MSYGGEGVARMRVLQVVVLIVFGVIAARLAYIQLIDSKYEELARGNALRYEVQYPSRGEVFDRNGEYLVQSRECYDLMVIYREMDREGFDTTLFCQVTGLSHEGLVRELANARVRPRAPRMVMNYMSKEDKLRFDECNFAGFYTVYRTARQYPRKVGGNLLGYVGEVNSEMLRRYPSYQAGEYVGISGVESAYEPELRGKKGVKISEVDTHGAIKGSYMDGRFDSLPVPGKSIVCTIDARLQLFAEELMAGKVGAAVAIEPSTGEILMMVSSPTYDPDELVGRQRGNHYMELLYNKRQPLFNRAVSGRYPPGSTFKLVQGLIGMQEGVLTPSVRYPCHEGYQVGRLKMRCHAHTSPADLRFAIATSCNAYFCYVFRDILENPRYGSVKEGFDVWREYVESFGFGRKLDSDFLGEGNGYVPVTTCTFRHLLPQVRLVCYSDRADVWGTIQTIEAADVHTRQELDLSAETPRLADISVAEDIRNLPVQDIAGLLIPQVASDGSPPEAQGYLLLPASPVDGTAAHPLHLRITTTKDGNGNLKETLSNVFVRIEGGFEIGKSHIVSLFFTGASNIQTTHVSVEAWMEDEQGEMPI